MMHCDTVSATLSYFGASEHKILSLLTVSAAPCAFSLANSHNN